MVIQLATKPGINGANTLSIPKDWDSTWFRKFIANSLKGADVRNAVGSGGIVVSGTIASPYATIGFGAPVTLPGPVTISAPTATNVSALTINGNPSSTAGTVRINTTSAGADSLVINGVTGTIGPDIDFTLNNVPKAIVSVASKTNENIVGSATGDFLMQTQGGNILFSVNSGAGFAMELASTGVLLMNGISQNLIALDASGAHFGLVSNNGAQSWCLGHAATINTAVTPIITWTNNATNSIAFFNGAGSGQVSGWGTPTGPAVVANFSGTAATLVQCSNAIAKIITDLKALGLYAA